MSRRPPLLFFIFTGLSNDESSDANLRRTFLTAMVMMVLDFTFYKLLRRYKKTSTLHCGTLTRYVANRDPL